MISKACDACHVRRTKVSHVEGDLQSGLRWYPSAMAVSRVCVAKRVSFGVVTFLAEERRGPPAGELLSNLRSEVE